MGKIKKIVSLLLVGTLTVFALAGCGGKETQGQSEQTILKVGASPVPHAEILNVAKELLAKEGIKLEIVEFQDYVQPNLALADGELDANYFQHVPYLESFSKEHNLKLTSVTGVHIEPMGVYSNKIKDINELKDGAQVAIPNDPTNGGRALLLLQSAGLIKLDPNAGLEATKNDIVENPKNLKVQELEAAMLPKVLDDVDIAVINTNYALDAGFNPTEDAIVIEGSDSPYVNVLVVRTGDENKEAIQKLAKALNSPEVKKFIEDKYKGAVVPAFE